MSSGRAGTCPKGGRGMLSWSLEPGSGPKQEAGRSVTFRSRRWARGAASGGKVQSGAPPPGVCAGGGAMTSRVGTGLCPGVGASWQGRCGRR